MDNLLNKLPVLIESKETGKLYEPNIYRTAWGKWCIAYKEMYYKPADFSTVSKDAISRRPFSVVIEPDRDPIRIEDTIGCLNEYIGNAPSFKEAVTMITDYVHKNYNIVK